MARLNLIAAALTTAAILVGSASIAGHTASAQSRSKRPTVTEPETGIKLPVTINVLKTMVGHRITGTAVREKSIFAVDVYACGHYVDADEARAALWKWKGKTAKELSADDDFREKLVTPGFGRSLRLQLARDVDVEDFNEAFEDSLQPRVAQLLKDRVKGSLKDIAKLKALFKLDELAEGTKLDFTWVGTTLTVRMNAKQLGAIESDALCRAMWDIYFGDDPIQSGFPRKLVELFPKILKTAEKPKPAKKAKK